MEFPANYIDAIKAQTSKTLWSLNNVMDSIPDSYWGREYCEAPVWRQVYHTLHSLDMWYIDPMIYEEPEFHIEGLNDLDVKTGGYLTRAQLKEYYFQVREKILTYLDGLNDELLLETPPRCPYTRFNLILAQHRHLDMHIGMLMGYVISGEGLWPRVLGLQSEYPEAGYSIYF